ncbi:MAG: 2-C-methyl-D-erythritol 4-phosphate cytidylyltransferase [Candidatus Omnitrophica bacterium]|nr:2-C-methyl-D-erythritol 4-phosphate cytidylyltransferase [Candidatus Omnitrophota bacterium]
MRRSNGISVIIPAAGSGKRFQESASHPPVSKLYSRLQNQPLIAHTLRAFDSASSVREIIVALEPQGMKIFRRKVLSHLKLKKPLVLVSGGKTRAQSVWNGLKHVSKKSTHVCIHDAARPLVKSSWLTHLINHLNGWDGVVLGRGSVSTVKMFEPKTGEIQKTIDRSELFEAETPQLIKKEVLLKAYQTLGKQAFQATDDASLIESIGGRIKAVPCSESNVKVTTYSDLVLIKRMVEPQPALKFGLGFDRHRLVSKRPFYLGGIRLKTSFGPLGHSDGDPLLHAITDAILGAVGAGDIGDFFPDTSRRWKNMKSTRFLKEAVRVAVEKGFLPLQVDATIFLERPKLGQAKKVIQAHIAKLLSLSPDEVSIKAKTAEGFGPEGAGQAVSCQALVVLGPSE